jgi:hypothetical protein
VATARFFLGGLADCEWEGSGYASVRGIEQDTLAEWLIRCGLAPFAYAQCRDAFPELAVRLEKAFHTSAARNALLFYGVFQVLGRFREAGIPVVVLKGAALAERAYGSFALRTMSDVDLWLRDEGIERATAIMQKLGCRERVKGSRPPALQALAGGERQFFGKWGLIELHWSPFPGWWLRWAAVVDDDAVWARAEPLVMEGLTPSSTQNPELVRRLAAEDMVIQVSVHLAVHHRFSVGTVRGLMDIALTARTRPVDWSVVVERAEQWRVKVAVWTALNLAKQLIGLPSAYRALERLRPSPVRRVLLQRLVSPESVLEGKDLRGKWKRYLIWLLLVDRPRDIGRLVFRTLWPEREWLTARYGDVWNRWQHLWNVVRHGEV